MEKKRMKYRQRQNFFKTDAWKRFRKNKLALVGTAVILLLILAAVFAPVIAQNDPYVSPAGWKYCSEKHVAIQNATRFLEQTVSGGMGSAVWSMRHVYL